MPWGLRQKKMSEVEQSEITNYFCLPLLKTRNTRCDDHSLRLQTRGTRESGLKKVNPGYHLDLKNLYYVNRKNGVFCDTGCLLILVQIRMYVNLYHNRLF